MNKWLKNLIKSWYLEGIIGVIATLIILYYLNKDSISRWLEESKIDTQNILKDSVSAFFSFIKGPEGKRIIFLSIGAIVVLLLLFWRILWRLQRSVKFTSTTCPDCNSPLVRVNRKHWQKIVSKLIPLRRLYCRNCGWKGVRIKGNDRTPLNTQPSKPTRIPIDKIS